MEKTDRTEQDNSQKTKLIFFSLAALVVVLLIWSVVVAGKARSERDAVKQELDMIKSDNVKLEQMVKDLGQENDTLKKKVQQLEAKPKAKPAPAKKKPAKTKKSTKSSKTK